MKKQEDHYSLHSVFVETKNRVYEPCRFECTQPLIEPESSEYGACFFELNGSSIRFRVAKITPTKVGQFVTLWKCIGNGPIQPFDISDKIDFVVITTAKEQYLGQFIFPKSVLGEKGVFSIKGKGGKRAIRVYPPWDTMLNHQAQKTQEWQMAYFLDIPQQSQLDCVRAKMLYRL